MLGKHLILHLTLIDGVGPSIVQRIMQLQRSGVKTSDLYALSVSGWMNYCGFAEKIACKLVTGLSDMTILEKELMLIEKHNVQLITIVDELYPPLLQEIHSPPSVLYAFGDAIFPAKCMAVVGARKANDYGRKIINDIVPDLVAAGYAIVSGGALGIDTMAHETILQCGGKTIAILGSGLLKPYPSVNKNLFKRIIESGGIVATSYPIMMESFPHHFPARNRIVTGLSKGCLVVQAAQKSGALISAHCALEQGREVFAVPGPFDDELSVGCHEIIQQGAKLVMSSADILNEFGEQIVLKQQALFSSTHSVERSGRFIHQSFLDKVSEDITRNNGDDGRQIQKDVIEIHSEAQQKIIAACKQPMSLEDIISITQLPFATVQSELFTLQLDGILSQDFTGMWQIK